MTLSLPPDPRPGRGPDPSPDRRPDRGADRRPDRGAGPAPSTPDPGLVSHALEVGARLAGDAAEVIAATRPFGGGRRDRAAHHFDWVTDTGAILERHTRRVLGAEFPGIPVFGPHTTRPVPATGEHHWLVSPVDGCANYLAELPWYGFSLALSDGSGPLVGVVCDPGRTEVYAAARDRGARVDGTRLRIGDRAVGPDHPVCFEPGSDRGEPFLRVGPFLARAARAGRGVRMLGSPALALVQVALGHVAATVLEGYRAWEVSAALAVVVEAGGVVLDRYGRPAAAVPEDGLLAAAPAVAGEVHDWWAADPG